MDQTKIDEGTSAVAIQRRAEKSFVQRICECYNAIEDAEKGVRRMCSACLSTGEFRELIGETFSTTEKEE